MRDALRRLAQDDWVVGVAAAIAIGYASVVFVHALARAVLHTIASDASGSFVVEIFGRGVHYQESLGATATLAIVVTLAAFLLRRAREASGAE